MINKVSILIYLLSAMMPDYLFAGGMGSGGSPPALDISTEQFNMLATGALRGELLEVMTDQGESVFYEPTALDVRLRTLEARSLSDESILMLKGWESQSTSLPSVTSKKIIPLDTPADLNINTVPRN